MRYLVDEGRWTVLGASVPSKKVELRVVVQTDDDVKERLKIVMRTIDLRGILMDAKRTLNDVVNVRKDHVWFRLRKKHENVIVSVRAQ